MKVEDYKDKIVRILTALFPNAKIYLFGSRARGTHVTMSDIDLAIDAGKPLERIDIGEARDMLAMSNIPFVIDIVDYHRLPERLKNSIDQEKIVWKE